jgi:predicted RNA-binding protein YlxR (DUF448 family)
MAIPIRSCILCRKRENWTDLLRVVLNSDQVLADPKHRLNGRGAWLHRNCFSVAKKRGSFTRAFRVEHQINTEALEVFLKGSE